MSIFTIIGVLIIGFAIGYFLSPTIDDILMRNRHMINNIGLNDNEVSSESPWIYLIKVLVILFMLVWYISGWVLVKGFWWCIFALACPPYPLYKTLEYIMITSN